MKGDSSRDFVVASYSFDVSRYLSHTEREGFFFILITFLRHSIIE